MTTEYDAWAARHAALFGLLSEQEAPMLAEWCDLFAREGYSVVELNQATDWLVFNAPPRYRSDHLAALVSRLRQQRREAQASPPPAAAADPRGTCTLCLGSGRVIVPSPKALAQGQWGTAAVLCRCALGKWWQDRLEGQRSLDSYEQEHPDWRERMKAHDDLLRQHQRARQTTRAIDQALGAIRRRAAQARQEETTTEAPPDQRQPGDEG